MTSLWFALVGLLVSTASTIDAVTTISTQPQEPYAADMVYGLSDHPTDPPTIHCPGRAIDVLYAVYRSSLDSAAVNPAVVTSRVRQECQAKETCTFAVNQDFFGFDPNPSGTYKAVSVIYRCVYHGMSYARLMFDPAQRDQVPRIDGRSSSTGTTAPLREPYPVIMTLTSHTDPTETISCPGGAIDIGFSFYYTENAAKGKPGAVVTSRMRQHCQGKESCTFTVGDTFFGFDPYVDVFKTLLTFHRCIYYGLSYSRGLDLPHYV